MKTKTTRFFTLAVKAAIIAFAVLSLATCEEEEDLSISQVTIHGIPSQIKTKNTFKIYLNASNSDLATVQHQTQSSASCTGGTITLNLYKPLPLGSDADPDTAANNGLWSGTAAFFSVMISPSPDDTSSVDDVLFMAGMNLNKNKRNINWDTSLAESLMKLEQKQALYDGMIGKDDEYNNP